MKINVAHIARLANLNLTKEEEEKFAPQLSEVLDYVKKLNALETKGVIETSQVTGLENVYREDIPEPSLTQEEALLDASSTHKGMFQVKGIIEEE